MCGYKCVCVFKSARVFAYVFACVFVSGCVCGLVLCVFLYLCARIYR